MSLILEEKKEGRGGQKKMVASCQSELTTTPEDGGPFRRRNQLSVDKKDDERRGDRDIKPERRYSEKLNVSGAAYELFFCDDGSGRPYVEQVNVTRPNSRITRCYKRLEEKDPSPDPSLYPLLSCFKFFGRESEWAIIAHEKKVYNNLAAVLLMANSVTTYGEKIDIV